MHTPIPRSLVSLALITAVFFLSLAIGSARLIRVGAAGAGEPSPVAVSPDKDKETVQPLAQCTSVNFNRTDFAAPGNPQSVAVSDFSGDGKADIATANATGTGVSLLLNNGSGSFGATTSFAAGAEPRSITVGDFNGDAKSDVATANGNSGDVSVLLGTGTGSFSAATNFTVGTGPSSIAVGDFNGDSKLDLVTANISSNNVSVLLGTGTGSFGAATNFAVGNFPLSVAVGDFNGDGKSDLATANNTSNNVSILLGTGTGSFGAATNFDAGTGPYSVAVGDFNGDANSDLVVANNGSANVSVLLGTGTGSFGAATNFAVGASPRSVAISDFNGDNKADLAITRTGANNVSILPGTGTGSFGTITTFAVGTIPNFVTIGDFNGDTKTDLVTANEGSNNVSVLLNGCVVSTIPVGNTNDSGAGSLRQAILDANAQPGVQVIEFNIGSGAQTINLLSGLPGITDPTVIDGTTQPGFAGTPIIELNGAGAGATGCLSLLSGGSTIKGLVINRFSGTAIHVQGGSGNTIQGNYIGTNVAGTAALNNSVGGIFVTASNNNLIGGTTAAERNVVSGNGNAVSLVNGSTGNLVEGNYVGTNAAGTAAISNNGNGVIIDASPNNTVGGTAAGAGNVISGSTNSGMQIVGGNASNNVVRGNYIGTNAAGTAAVPNGGDGIFIFGSASNNTIGGTTPAARNVISGNGDNGISFRDTNTSGNVVSGNYIGTNAAGTSRIQNQNNGVIFGNNALNNRVGGTTAGAGNVISGNNQSGVVACICGSGPGGSILIQGNFIGTNAAGTAAIANSAFGVIADNTPNNTIGGTAAGARNLLSGNTFENVTISGANATGNTVAGNFIGTNAAGTAGLGGSGVGLHDGANNNTVGGTTAAARNIISGNSAHGVGFGGLNNNVATNNRVQGNYIGLNAAGNAVVANTFSGVILQGTNTTSNLIGGTAAGAGNVIAGNGHQAVAIVEGASNNTIQGNFMGTDATGNGALGGVGVFIGNGASNNLIGGTAAGARNVISGNSQALTITNYITDTSTGNRVEGNYIGLNAGGTAPLSNVNAIFIGNVSGNTIGGTAAGAGNIIANNLNNGIVVDFSSGPRATGNAILSNSIFNNGGPGIALPNGGNNNQAAPVINSAVLNGGNTAISGTLTSTPSTNFNVQFFVNAACDSSGFGEGQEFLGTISVTTNASGIAPISFIASGVESGQVITATATSAANHTSQFSACRLVTSLALTISGRVTGAGGAGLANVTVTLSGAGAQTVQTDASGNYSFNVVAGRSYTVFPTSPYFVFTPLRADFPNISTGEIANFAVVPQATPTPTPPLQDNFNGAQRDPDKWNLGTLTQPAEAFDPQVSVTQQGGQLVITPRKDAQAPSFNGYVSVKAFDFTNGQVSVEVPKAAGGASAETAFAIGSDSQNNYRFVVTTLANASQSVREQFAKRMGGWDRLDADMLVLVFQVKISGVVTQAAIPYDPVQLKFWRFRHDPPQNSILFETSPDNAAYVERFRKALEKGVSSLAVELTAGTTASATDSSNATFDNLSLVSGTAQFSSDNLNVSEGDGRITITVTRSGNVAGSPATLTYLTTDSDTFTVGCFDRVNNQGAAYARCDFATTVGTLQFAIGETSKSFTVPLIDDGFGEDTETFQLRLTNASGAALGAPALIRVSIQDNDGAGGANPVVTSPSFFVRQQYLDFLSREPDQGGLNAWLNVLNNCQNIFTPPTVPSGC
ncbi:MAG TPA: FG-GAP-like repeat-containing protein, partial [Pyrinomonadaceae bacterium]|nr:FG-GAP-like repeat-containing protein [Pyrinomonadaceae bacterium]